MTPEELIKERILERYKSVRAFTQDIGVSYSTVDSMLKRGIYGAGVGTVLKVCNALGLEVEEVLLETNEDSQKKSPLPIEPVTEEDEADPKFWETAAWLQELVIKAGWVKPGEELSDKQDQLLQAIILLLQAGQNPR